MAHHLFKGHDLIQLPCSSAASPCSTHACAPCDGACSSLSHGSHSTIPTWPCVTLSSASPDLFPGRRATQCLTSVWHPCSCLAWPFGCVPFEHSPTSAVSTTLCLAVYRCCLPLLHGCDMPVLSWWHAALPTRKHNIHINHTVRAHVGL